MIAIVTDSTCDLPQATIDELDIRVVPAILVLEGQSFLDGIELTREEFYDRLPDLPTPPTTSAPSSGMLAKAYESAFNRGASHVVSLHVASTLSAIVNAAEIATQSFGDRVTVIDSGQLSLGLGFQVMAAAEAAAAGGDLEMVLEAVRQVQRRVQVVAMLDSLEYLRRGGRVSFIKASLGSMLRMRIFVELHDGRINFLEQVRTRGKALARLWEIIVSLGRVERFALLHAAAESDALELMDRLRPDLPEGTFLVNVNTVIGTHVGPGAVGFAALI